MSPDQFSVRWTGTFNFNAGTYNFSGWTDDGMRVYVAGTPQLSTWTHPQSHAVSWQQTFASNGPREVRIEYYENDGWARAELDWAPAWPSSCPSGQYRAEYFNNASLAGPPSMVRCEGAPLEHEWGYDAPSGANVSPDQFSVRWTGTFNFNAGTYNFSGWTDDGMRVYVAGQPQLSTWTHPQSHAVSWQQTFASNGPREVRIEYYENDGWARAELDWQVLQSIDVELISGAALTGQSVAETGWKYYYIDVPTGASGLTVTINGSGDPDLYTRYLSKPTVDSWACRPFTDGADEQCQHSAPAAGRWWIGVHGFTTATYAVAATVLTGQGAVSPAAPTYDRIVSTSTSSVTLHWEDNALNEDFYLAYRIAPGPSVQVGGSLAAGTTSVTHTGLASNTQYFYQVYAWNQSASVFPGTYMAGRTLNNSPAPPRVLAAWGTSTSSIRINWQDNSNNEQGFRVQRWNGSGFTLAGTTGPNVTTFTDTSGLSAGAGYYYIVQSFNADGSTNSLGGISALTFASTPGTPPGPLAPSYTGASSTSTTATINWTDNASDEQFYLVYRIAPGPSTLIATLNPNSTSFQDTGLTAGTQYYYQVYAWNGAGSNTAGSFIVAKTLSTYPDAPNLQSAAAKSSTSMKVTWIDKSTTETGFRVLRYNGSGWDLAGTTAANATSFIDTGLTPGTSYVYLVTSFNFAGESWAPDAVWAPTLP